MLEETPTLPISLAYAPTPDKQLYLEIKVAVGTQLLQALQQVGWLCAYPELGRWCQAHHLDTQVDNKRWWVGVYADKALLTYTLKAHDRIEVYRPLSIEPMRKRKNRATQQ